MSLSKRAGVPRTALVGVVVAISSFAGTSIASAQESDTESSQPVRARMDISASRFVVRHGDVFAKGTAVASARRSDGSTRQVVRRVHLRADTGSSCEVLKLSLAASYINLLGLEIRTSDINVRITGDSKKRLGALFCKLASNENLSSGGSGKRIARAINRGLRGHPLPVMRVRAKLYPQQGPRQTEGTTADQIPPPAAGSCEVLNIFLGPLDLDLLGLQVVLYGETPSQGIHVLATADPNKGELGRVLCQVGGQPSA